MHSIKNRIVPTTVLLGACLALAGGALGSQASAAAPTAGTVVCAQTSPTPHGPYTGVVVPGVPYFGGPGPDVILGTPGNDVISGGGGNDIIWGLGGNDTINGNTGNDTVSGGGGNDKIYGGNQDDCLRGDAGKDTLYGDPGNDTLHGNDGEDILRGNDGNDRFSCGSDWDEAHGGAPNGGFFPPGDALLAGAACEVVAGMNP